MAPLHRHQQILTLLQKQGKASISELATHFDVSDETIRRDLKGLSASGSVEKFHGGVRLPDVQAEPPFERRLRENIDAKTRIAKLAADYIADDSTVLLDNSSSACFLARELVHRAPLTIVTISLEIAQIFASAHSDHRIILPGGELRIADRTFAGAQTVEFLSQFTPNYFVMSIVAASERGCQDYDLFEAQVKRAMIPRAEQTIVLVDSSKFNRSGLIQVCDWSQVDVLVSDAVPPEVAERLEHGSLLLTEG